MSISNPYAGISATEADLRHELNSMFFGDGYEVAKSNKVLFRRMRRSGNNLIECPCVDKLTREPDIDIRCEYCRGEGYLWDEDWISVRSVIVGSSTNKLVFKSQHLAAGELNSEVKVFFVQYSVQPTMYDRIVELYSDREGEPALPYRRHRAYRFQTVQPLRSDHGRIEFYAVWCSQKDAIQIEEDYRK